MHPTTAADAVGPNVHDAVGAEPAWSVDRADGVAFVRGGCAGEPAPKEWRERFTEALRRHGPDAVVVAKRVGTDGALRGMGDFVVHPKGLHGLGCGAPADRYRFPEEVDGAVAGVAAFPIAGVEGLAAPRGGLGLLTWCLEARLRGFRVLAVPEVRFETPTVSIPVAREDVDAFESRFGFSPIAADLEVVASRADLARLRWNARLFGAPLGFEKYRDRGAFHWRSYREVDAFRARADLLARLAIESSPSGSAPILDIGCGDGLSAFLLAERGAAVIGIDDDPTAVAHARRECILRLSPSRAPRFELGTAYALPISDASARGAILLDTIEHLANPIRALRELARVLVPGGVAVISTPEWQFGASSDPVYHAFEFTLEELTRLVEATGSLRVERTARIGGPYRDLVVVAVRSSIE